MLITPRVLFHACPGFTLCVIKRRLDREDCLIAQGTKFKNISLFKETSDIYERLFDLESMLTDFRFRVEAVLNAGLYIDEVT